MEWTRKIQIATEGCVERKKVNWHIQKPCECFQRRSKCIRRMSVNDCMLDNLQNKTGYGA